MAEWQQFLQSIFIGLIFSYLLAKLISVVVSFKEDNLTIARASQLNQPPQPTKSKPSRGGGGGYDIASAGDVSTINETESMTAEQGSIRNESLIGGSSDQDIGDDDDDDDDDWEGVESTELDEEFSAATAFVAAAAADRLSHKVSSDLQLQLYALYKIATEGPCSAPPPSALKMTARAKWQAWQKLGAMPPEDAMQKYIDIVTELYPTWASGAVKKRKDGHGDTQNTDAKRPMGPVFSTHVFEEEAGNELKMEAIHAFAREGDVKNLLKCIENGVSVNLKDSEGRAPIHWAVDRGHLNVVEALVGSDCDINAKDNEGQTALHYAAVCEREAIAELLIKQNADVNVKDNDGKSVNEVCEVNWRCLQAASTQSN